MPKDWEQWEREVQRRLGLDPTIASGNQFQDPGDAVDHSNPRDSAFRLEVDCKHTRGATFRLSAGFWKTWSERAAESGKRFLLAVRMEAQHAVWAPDPQDFVVLSLDDFEELLERAYPRIQDRTWDD